MQAVLAISPIFAFQSVTASAAARCDDAAAQHAAMLNPRRFRFEFRVFMASTLLAVLHLRDGKVVAQRIARA
jgi:hypothetical protein